MIVLDTHAWIWWIDDRDQLSKIARRAVDSDEDRAVSAVSHWELGMLAQRGRIGLDRDVRAWTRAAAAQVRTIDVDATIALDAALLGDGDFPKDPADRMIYSTARAQNAPLVTRDRAIRAYDPRGTIW